MDYKYIDQLLERYWNCETTLEEEEILRSFFSQDNVPVELLRYRQLFVYESREPQADRLGADFDEKMLQQIGDGQPVKIRRMKFTARLMPLFRAAAMVAILLTLGNAVQMSFNSGEPVYTGMGDEVITNGESDVALIDTARIDTVKQSSVIMPVEEVPQLLK